MPTDQTPLEPPEQAILAHAASWKTGRIRRVFGPGIVKPGSPWTVALPNYLLAPPLEKLHGDIEPYRSNLENLGYVESLGSVAAGGLVTWGVWVLPDDRELALELVHIDDPDFPVECKADADWKCRIIARADWKDSLEALRSRDHANALRVIFDGGVAAVIPLTHEPCPTCGEYFKASTAHEGKDTTCPRPTCGKLIPYRRRGELSVQLTPEGEKYGRQLLAGSNATGPSGATRRARDLYGGRVVTGSAVFDTPQKLDDRAPADHDGQPRKSARLSDKLSREVHAMGLLKTHPDWTAKEIARQVGVHHRTLWKWELFRNAWKHFRRAPESLPRGTKHRETGDLEAWDEG